MKVLIVRLSAIGDVIHTIPTLMALKQSFPEWRISWLAEELSAPLIENHPCLERVFVIQRSAKQGHSVRQLCSDLASYWSVRKALQRERFDLAIDFQGLLKSGVWAWASGAPRRLGHRQSREFARLFLTESAASRPALDPLQSIIERNLELAAHLGADVSKAAYLLPDSSEEVRRGADRLLASIPVPARPLLAFCPFSAWPTKNWPLEHWRELARELAREFQIIIAGSKREAAGSESIAEAAPGALNLAGKTTLPELAEIFRRCTLVVGADTGPAHLATAVNGPRVLMLFGATPWRRTGPFGEAHSTLSLDLECQPCFERQCPLGHFNCLRTLSPARVLEAAREMAAAK